MYNIIVSIVCYTNALSVPYCSLETATEMTTTGIGRPVTNILEFCGLMFTLWYYCLPQLINVKNFHPLKYPL